MPKLPDLNDLSGIRYQPVRQFVNIPNVDMMSGYNAIANGISDLAGGFAKLSANMQEADQKAERYNTNMALIEAESRYNEEASKYDPLEPDYPEKIATAWDNAVKDILTGVKDPDNKMTYSQKLLESRFSLRDSARTKQEGALKEKSVLDLEDFHNYALKSIDTGEDPEKVRLSVEQMIDDNPWIKDENDKRKLKNKLLPLIDERGLEKKALGWRTGGSGGSLPIVTANQAGRVSKGSIEGVNGELINRFKTVQDVFGKSIPIVSGFRDPATNKKAGGAKKSQHLDGNAIDLDVSGMPYEERRRLIEIASANGITGIGVYKNSLHFDLGSRRAWGPTKRRESVPPWAAEAIMRHETGTVRPQGGITGGMSFDQVWSRLINAESGGNQSAVSSKGAIGRAQIMPTTGPDAAKYAGLPWDLERLKNDPQYNEALGQALLKHHLKTYGGDYSKALAAYNAGSGAVDRAVEKGGDNWVNYLPDETQGYLGKIVYAQGGAGVSAPTSRMTTSQAIEQVRADPAFQRLPIEKQDSLISSITTQFNKLDEEDKLAKAQLTADYRLKVDSDLKSIEDTGQGDPNLTIDDVSFAMGPTEAAKWYQARQVNKAIWDATSKFVEMPDAQVTLQIAEMKDSLEGMKGTPQYGIMEKVIAAAEAKHNELKNLRRDDPFTAAEQLPGVKGYIEDLMDPRRSKEGESLASRTELAIEAAMDAQRKFGFRRDTDLAPIPKRTAIELGMQLQQVGFEAAALDQTDSPAAALLVRKQYEQLQTIYGKYTPDVIAYSLGVTTTMSRDSRELLTDTLTALGTGKQLPAERRAANRAKREAEDQQRAMNGWGQRLFSWMGGDEEQPQPAQPYTPPVNNEPAPQDNPEADPAGIEPSLSTDDSLNSR